MSAWLKKWGYALLAALGALGAILVGLGWLWERKKLLGAARDQKAVDDAKAQIAVLQDWRDEVATKVGADDVAISDIDRRIQDQRIRIVHMHEGGDKVPDDQLEQAFRELGI